MGGSGGGGTTNTAQFKPPDYAVQGWQDYVNNASAITQSAYQPYYGMEIAPINNAQVQGLQYMSNLAANGAPDYNTARAMNQITAAGGFENPGSAFQTENGTNPWMGSQTWAGVNAYEGFSPEYQQFKQNSMDDIVGAYQRGTAAQTDTAMNRAGAFGGGAHLAQISANENNLARNLARQSSEMDFGQWDRSGALYENYLGRDMQSQLQSQNLNSQMGENALNRSLTAQTNDYNRYSQNWDSERNRQMQSLQNAIQGGQFEMSQAQHLVGVGDVQRQYQQDMLNQYKNNYNQWLQHPFQMLDAYGSALSRASGNYGTNTATSSQNYQANPYAAIAGAGLLGAGMYAGM
jgi:hypothetical protein